MLQLLNKFAWFLCFAVSFTICNTIFGKIALDSYFMIAIIAAFVLKGIFFPKNYILKRLQFFKNHILTDGNEEENNVISQENSTEYTPEEYAENEDTINKEYDSRIEFPIEIPEKLTPLQEEASIESKPLHDLIKNIDDDENQDDDIGTVQYSSKIDSSRSIKKEKKELTMFEKFFAENLLAKIGGIFVFLGVLFLLGLVYTMIGPVVKLILGFIVGGLCYTAGVWLDKKGYREESRIVLGIALLINYLVILWGRYYLGNDDSSGTTILSVGITFFFLICNTILAVITSHIYNSRALLIFAFVVAYINPFLLGESSSEPYTLLGYTMIVTFGAMFIAYKKKDEALFPLSFTFAALLILIAPWIDGSGWVVKLLCINILGALGLYVSTVFKKKYVYIFEMLISGTFFLIGVMGVLGGETLSSLQFAIMGASSLGLMALCYTMMHKGTYLYSIGTIGTILTLTPVILQNGMREDTVGVASLIILVFGAMNIGITLWKPKRLLAENIRNTISGLVGGALFLIFMILVFGNKYFPGVPQGLCFFGLSAIYATVTYILAYSIGIKNISQNKDDENLVYSIFALSISLLTLAIAFLFAEQKEVISIAWLLEANVLFFLASRIQSVKVAFIGVVLMMIGIVKFIDFIDLDSLFTQIPEGAYGMLVTFVIVFTSFILNLLFIKPKNTETPSYLGVELTFIHNVLHVLGMGVLLIWGNKIMGISDDWISLLYFSTSVMILGVIYEKLISPGLQKVHIGAYIACIGVHISAFYFDMGTENLRFGISTLIAGIYSLPFVYDYVKNGVVKNENLFSIFIGYMLILSTLYLYHIFGVSFAVTSYWAVISFLFISYNISKDKIQEKTIATYIFPMVIISALFHSSPEIATVILFLQSLILFFYGCTLKSLKISVLGLILYSVGVYMLAYNLDPIQTSSMIIAGFIIFVTSISSLLFTKNSEKSLYLPIEFIWIYNIVHVIGMIILAIWGHDILGITNDWFSLLYYSIIIMILGVIYEKMSTAELQKIHLSTYISLMGMHILLFASHIETTQMNLGISTLIVGMYALPFIYDYLRKGSIENKPLFIVFLSYLFILSSLYVYQIFGITFMVTLYWGVLAFGILSYGISKDILYMRTLGLYLITLTASKVFLYDIWMSVDDTVSRVIALIVVGILMIVLSTMYTKKFGNNLNAEFKISNLFPEDNIKSHKKYISLEEDSDQEIQKKAPKKTIQNPSKNKNSIQSDIESIDVSGIVGVRLLFNGENKAVQIRAENLIRIAKLIENTYGKKSFNPGELSEAFAIISNNYKSQLSPSQYTKVKDLIEKFVQVGGSIEYV